MVIKEKENMNKFKLYNAQKMLRKHSIEKERGPSFQEGVSMYSVTKIVKFSNGKEKPMKFYLTGDENHFGYRTYSSDGLTRSEDKFMEKNHDDIFNEIFKKCEVPCFSEQNVLINVRQKNFVLKTKVQKKLKAEKVAEFEQGRIEVYYDEKKNRLYFSFKEVNDFMGKFKKGEVTNRDIPRCFNQKTLPSNRFEWVSVDGRMYASTAYNSDRNIMFYDENKNLYVEYNVGEFIQKIAA